MLEILKRLHEDPKETHVLKCTDERHARKVAYQLRDAIHAAAFSDELKHFAKLADIFMIKVEFNNVRAVPRIEAELLLPLPSWAEPTGNDWYAHRRASTVVEVLLAIKEVPSDGSVRGVTFPNFNWQAVDAEKKVAIWEEAKERNWSVFEWIGERGDFAVTHPFGQDYSWHPEYDEEGGNDD